jgi:S1-C subfamily serine protease
MQRSHALGLAGALSLSPVAVYALDAGEVFRLAEPSIVVVLASDANQQKGRLGSGVLVAPLEVVTSCKIVDGAADIVLTQGNSLRKATLHLRDPDRDLCQLQVESALPSGQPARLADRQPSTGHTVYAISSPQGMELSINRSMISSLREVPGSAARLIQIDLRVQPASHGGGVFDEDGRLLGLITGEFKRTDSETYAVPAVWIAELPSRAQSRLAVKVDAAVAAAAAPPASANEPWRPEKGERWRYRLLDGTRTMGTINVEVLASSRVTVRERITREGIAGFLQERDVSPALNAAAFAPLVTLPGGYQLIEMSAYFPPGTSLQTGAKLGALPGEVNVPTFGKRQVVWETRVVKKERVRVPAGEFEAWKIEAVTNFNAHYGNMRVTCDMWYSPEARRAVKMHTVTRWLSFALDPGIESLELIGYESAAR